MKKTGYFRTVTSHARSRQIKPQPMGWGSRSTKADLSQTRIESLRIATAGAVTTKNPEPHSVEYRHRITLVRSESTESFTRVREKERTLDYPRNSGSLPAALLASYAIDLFATFDCKVRRFSQLI